MIVIIHSEGRLLQAQDDALRLTYHDDNRLFFAPTFGREKMETNHADFRNLITAAFTAMGSGETIRKALARAAEGAPELKIHDSGELIRVLQDVGEVMIAAEIQRRIEELWKGESPAAVAGIWELVRRLSDDALFAAGFATVCAQANCGEHPNPDSLIRDMEFDSKGFRFGDSWKFWGGQSPLAIKAAKFGFVSSILLNAGFRPK